MVPLMALSVARTAPTITTQRPQSPTACCAPAASALQDPPRPRYYAIHDVKVVTGTGEVIAPSEKLLLDTPKLPEVTVQG